MHCKQLYLITLFALLIVVPRNPAIAAIRMVPEQYPLIHGAVQSAMSGDTILLALGVYHESTTIDRSLTIASNWILSGDTSAITNTMIHGYGSFAFNCVPDSELINVRFAGIIIDIIDTNVFARGAISGTSSNLRLDHVTIKSSVSIPVMGAPTLLLQNNTCLTANNSNFWSAQDEVRYFLDANGGKVELNHCNIVGPTAFREDNWLMHLTNTVLKIYDCEFRFRSRGIIGGDSLEIMRTTFYQTGAYTLYLAGDGPGEVSDCHFIELNCHNQFPYRIICNYQTDPEIIQFKRCEFVSCQGYANTNCSALFYGTDNHDISSCKFTNNTNFQYLIHGGGVFDSLLFDHNPVPLFANHISNRIYQVFVSSTDFIGSTTLVIDPGTHPSFDAFVGENCYWGDPSGPRHPSNPGGTGITVPIYTIYAPFRTTPVFGPNVAPERQSTFNPQSLKLLSAYPNPFNSSTTIRYSLPHAGEATIAVYDVTGRVVTELRRGYLPVGDGSLLWRPDAVASGTYFVRMKTNNGVSHQEIHLIK